MLQHEKATFFFPLFSTICLRTENSITDPGRDTISDRLNSDIVVFLMAGNWYIGHQVTVEFTRGEFVHEGCERVREVEGDRGREREREDQT